jgi:hypothetical protein
MEAIRSHEGNPEENVSNHADRVIGNWLMCCAQKLKKSALSATFCEFPLVCSVWIEWVRNFSGDDLGERRTLKVRVRGWGMALEASNGVAQITRRAADRLRKGYLWVYRSDVERMELPDEVERDTGSLVSVVDSRRIPLGSALYSEASEIALRMVSQQPGLRRAEYLSEVRARVESALALRAAVAPEVFEPGSGTNACRLLFAEADNLPGIVADRYNGIVVLQLLTQGTARQDVRDLLAEIFAGQPWAEVITERPDARVRELEKLEPVADGAMWSRDENASMPAAARRRAPSWISG